MQGNRKAQLFALDLMLAMIPLTIIIGISATAMAGVTTQMQEYMYGYSLQRITLDAADVLIKTPGEPYNWENDTTTLETLGLASIVENISQSHSLDVGKVLVLNQSSGSNEVKESLRYLAGGNNIRMSLYYNRNGTEITNLSQENIRRMLDIASYWDNSVWTMTDDSATIDAEIANGITIYVQERLATFGVIPYGLWDIPGLENINTSQQPGWGSYPGTFDIENPSENNAYYVLIYYLTDPPAGTPHTFKNLYLNGQEVTLTYSYPSMDLDDKEPFSIDQDDSGLLLPIDYSLISASNTITISVTGNVQENMAVILLVVPSGTPQGQVGEYIDLSREMQNRNVLVKVVVWK